MRLFKIPYWYKAMQKTYSLLRNNKQSGPYTLEELLQLKLKPFDLVWVDGKSAGWSYPSEIDALKDYVTDIPKSVETEEAALSTQSPEGNIISQPTAKEFVSKKTTVSTAAKHIYISLPAGTHIKENAISFIPPAENIEEESPEAKLERKAQELRNKIQAFSESKNQPNADNDLDTKYARSLDDIKEEYSSWLHQQKKKKNAVPKKTYFIIAGFAVLFIGAYFIIRLFSNAKTNEEHILSAEEIKSSAPVFNSGAKKENVLEKKGKLTKGDPGKKSQKMKSNKTNPGPLKTHSPNSRIDKIDSYIDSLNRIEGKKQQRNESEYKPPVASSEDTRGSNKRNDETITKKPTERNATSSAPFEELVKLSESIGNGTPHLTLYNNSNKHIKFIAIDAFYYRANKQLLEKKTLYFNNISAMSTATLYVPQEKKAASVRYEMGLISTNGGLYYAKQ
jgi:hypothetical protein